MWNGTCVYVEFGASHNGADLRHMTCTADGRGAALRPGPVRWSADGGRGPVRGRPARLSRGPRAPRALRGRRAEDRKAGRPPDQRRPSSPPAPLRPQRRRRTTDSGPRSLCIGPSANPLPKEKKMSDVLKTTFEAVYNNNIDQVRRGLDSPNFDINALVGPHLCLRRRRKSAPDAALRPPSGPETTAAPPPT